MMIWIGNHVVLIIFFDQFSYTHFAYSNLAQLTEERKEKYFFILSLSHIDLSFILYILLCSFSRTVQVTKLCIHPICSFHTKNKCAHIRAQ
jgi:hypothetical protein